MSEWVVVDTNVLLIAEGRSDYTKTCQSKCGTVLKDIQRHQIVLLDGKREILKEYGKKLAECRGQPGLGYEFWKWLINAGLSHGRCEIVNLTPHVGRGYEEFPEHEDLEKFDRSDRKFVAVAAAHRKKPKIVQAGDSKWWGWKNALSECGIELDLPCEAELQAKWEAKMGKNA